MRPARLGIAIAAALLGAAAAACSVDDVVVAREVGGPEGGGRCVDSRDCSGAAFCAKPSCDAPEGRCELRPVQCGDEAATACGCDGVNYWNDCLRRQNGVAASAGGECTAQFRPCGGYRGAPCPTGGAFCARLSVPGSGPCDWGTPGVCWVLPQRCPPDDGGALWQSCGDRPPMCADVCEAIRAERPYRLPFDPSACP